MDLNYTPEDIAFRKQVRTWLEGNLPRKEIRTLDDRLGWHRKLYEAGYLGMGWPKEYGGGGARPMEQAIVSDELARANAPAPSNSLGIGIVGPTIVVHGTEAQKKRYLRKILTAEELWCQLYSEPNAGTEQQPRDRHRRPDHRRPRHGGPEEAVPQKDPHGRGAVVPALLRAQCRHRATASGSASSARPSSSTARRPRRSGTSERSSRPRSCGASSTPSPMPAPSNSLGIGIVGPTIVVHGTEAQKKRYLRKILTAEELWCQLYSEPNAGTEQQPRDRHRRPDHRRPRHGGPEEAVPQKDPHGRGAVVPALLRAQCR